MSIDLNRSILLAAPVVVVALLHLRCYHCCGQLLWLLPQSLALCFQKFLFCDLNLFSQLQLSVHSPLLLLLLSIAVSAVAVLVIIIVIHRPQFIVKVPSRMQQLFQKFEFQVTAGHVTQQLFNLRGSSLILVVVVVVVAG